MCPSIAFSTRSGSMPIYRCVMAALLCCKSVCTRAIWGDRCSGRSRRRTMAPGLFNGGRGGANPWVRSGHWNPGANNGVSGSIRRIHLRDSSCISSRRRRDIHGTPLPGRKRLPVKGRLIPAEKCTDGIQCAPVAGVSGQIRFPNSFEILAAEKSVGRLTRRS